VKILMLADASQAAAMGEPARWLHDVNARRAAAGHRVRVIEVGREGDAGSEGDDPPGVEVLRPPPGAFEAALGEALDTDPDLVHVATSGPLGARVVEILRDLPVLLDIHDFWAICPRDDLLRMPKLTPCGEHYPFSGCAACAGLPRLRHMEERLDLAAAASIVITHSSFTRARVNAGLRRRIELVPYGVDTRRFHEASEANAEADAERLGRVAGTGGEAGASARVLFLGEPTFGRGSHLVLDLLVALRARVPEAELIVTLSEDARAGWGESFKAEAWGMGLADHVQMLPSTIREALPALYRSCVVAVAPLVGHEPGGLALIEAMASALPVVASPLGAVQDLIVDGEEGLLVDANDVVRFADALQRLIIDPGARAAMGAAARTRVLNEFTIERSIARLESFYDGMKDRSSQAA
jgi:glycosyltransferase involved in cell wall biosynthesis